MSVNTSPPLAVRAADVPDRPAGTGMPAPFATLATGRSKKQLGNLFGLTNFGVNITRLAPGAQSSLMHRHKVQDEFIFILEGRVVLETDRGEVEMTAGMCAGFAKGGVAHHLVNRSGSDVLFLEVGDRTPGDIGEYPGVDLRAVINPDSTWRFEHKDGTPY